MYVLVSSILLFNAVSFAAAPETLQQIITHNGETVTLDMDCSDGVPTPCGRANIDDDNDVDIDDLLELAGNWLQ